MLPFKMNFGAISPEQEKTNRAMGLASSDRGAFDPEIHDPDDPSSWTRMVKPIGNYGWGGMAALGEGMHNAWVMNRADQARGEQRASQAAGSAALDKFVAGGGLAGGVDAIAPLLRHPGMRQTGMSMMMESQREKRAAEQSDRQHARALEMDERRGIREEEKEGRAYQRQLDDPLRKAQTSYYADRAEIGRLKADAERLKADTGAQAERRRYLEENFEQDERGNLVRKRGEPVERFPDVNPSAAVAPIAPIVPKLGDGFGGMRGGMAAPPMKLGGPLDDVSVGPASARGGLAGGVQVAQAPSSRQQMDRIQIPQPGAGASPSELRSWAQAQDAARRANKEVDRNNALGKPPKEDNALTNEDIQEYYRAKFGELGKGDVYRRDGTVQSLKLTQNERINLDIAFDAVESVRNARELLKGTGFFAEAAGFSGIVPPAMMSKDAESANLAKKQMEASTHDFLKIMSGATVSDKERAKYIEMYIPSVLDSPRLRAWKLDRVESFFNRTIQSKRAGATGDDVSKAIRAELAAQPGSKMMVDKGKDAPSREPPRAMIPEAQQQQAPSGGRKVYDRETGTFKEVR